MKYRLKKGINRAHAGVEFEYKKDINIIKEVNEGQMCGAIASCIQLANFIGIDNTDYFEKVEEYDFSEFVGRHGNTLAIKGDKLLKSYPDGDIFYSNDIRNCFIGKVNYIETTLDELKKGDMFIMKYDIENMEKADFNILIGEDNDGDYVVQYLDVEDGIERITDYAYTLSSSKKVIKFLRD